MTPTNNAASAFPLAWPAGQKRSASRKRSAFKDRSVAVVYDELKSELSRLGARYVVVSTNVPLKNDGTPYSNPGRMNDPGAAVYFKLYTATAGNNGRSYCLPCDKWDRVEDNLYAIAKHIEAMRGMDRWGVGSVEQNFAGFAALPASTKKDWWDVLGVKPDASLSEVKGAYAAKLTTAHPDRGGSHEAMAELNVARDEAFKTKGGA